MDNRVAELGINLDDLFLSDRPAPGDDAEKYPRLFDHRGFLGPSTVVSRMSYLDTEAWEDIWRSEGDDDSEEEDTEKE